MQIGRSNHTYKPLIEQLTYQNGIVDKVSFRYLELEQRPTPQFMWDIVVSDVVSPQGVLLTGGLEELAFLRFVSTITAGVTCVHRMTISTFPFLRSLLSPSIFTPPDLFFFRSPCFHSTVLISDLNSADLT